MSKLLKETFARQDSIESGTGINFILENKLNKLFKVKGKEEEQERIGLHASAILSSHGDFCLREQVLSIVYKRNAGEAHQFSDGLLRIFKEGNCVHEKWQKMLEENGLAIGTEKRAYNKRYNLYLTPDSIIKMDNQKYIVEIKSCNTFSFKKIRNVHPVGSKQIQLYMHFLGIPKGFVLCEDKNDQTFKCLYTEYNYKVVLPYLKRLEDIRECFINKKIPRKDPNISSRKCEECAMSQACSGKNKVRLSK